MKYRKLVNGDYCLASGNDFYQDAAAVGQAIKTNLLLLQGEWWEDVDKGLPLFQHILGASGAPNDTRAADLLVQDVIANTTGVLSIASFTSTYDKRNYTVSCTVQTQYGDVAVEEVTF